MATGKKTGGRTAGTPNKTTVAVKAALEEAFDRLGGVDSLVTWAQSEPTEFYKLYAKLLPAELNVKHSGLDALAERMERASNRNGT